MSTNQPVWEFLANLGDVNPLDYGGAFVMQDDAGVYPPELWIYEADERTRHTVLLEPIHACPDVPCQYGDNKSHPNYPAWWSGKLQSVADTHGMPLLKLVGLLLSDEPTERAAGYQCLIGHFGVHEFDQYPDTLTRKEARAWMRSIDSSLA